ncbi:hypothetical protein NW759_009161 [Fusarium solani]|nr:hypothetical protein NW759_009161 [Fusarium solani]
MPQQPQLQSCCQRAALLSSEIDSITDGERCRLIETAKTEPTGPYTALSYRWGPDPHHLILTAQNLPWLSEGIRCAELPRTFQDAISITRKLGMGYLWVDSLCILQDGEGATDDWLRHVQVMGSIYEGCSLNIAAADAADAHGGCYFSRDALTLACPLVDMRVGDRKRTLELASPEIQGRLALFPLNSRAWVFQERLLAPRTVHFARHQIFWECGKVPAASERFPRGMPRYYHEWNWGTERQLPTSSIYDPPPAAPRYLHDVWTLKYGWEMAVEDFNATAMTRPEDKLPAIAGVAARISRLTNDDYVAEFFKSQLPHGLLWSGRRWGGEFRRFRHQYRAPSWSWASTDGPVDFLEPCSSFMGCHKDVECAQVLETRVDLVNESDPFGQIRFASIKLSGPSFVREIVRAKGVKEPRLQSMAPLQDLREDWDFPKKSLRHLISSKVHLFVVRTTPEEDAANGYYVQGLILCPMQSVGDRIPSQLFERIGTFRVTIRDDETVRTELANATREIIIV